MINRSYISAAVSIVRSQLRLKSPITLEDLLGVVERLGGRHKAVEDGAMNVEARISTPEEPTEYQFLIQYLQEQPEERVLFSIAHELGHLVLHMIQDEGKLAPAEVYSRSEDSSQKELEANEFAAILLMPADEFIDKCKECMKDNCVNITEVAGYFNVSNQAALLRGKVLKLW